MICAKEGHLHASHRQHEANREVRKGENLLNLDALIVWMSLIFTEQEVAELQVQMKRACVECICGMFLNYSPQ